VATDIHPELMKNLTGANLEVRRFDVVNDEPQDAPFDLIVVRALLHHLPQRREVVTKMMHWLKPGGWLFIHEPDFYPAWTVEPDTQRKFWEQFIQWAATHDIDYYVGRKIAPWLQEEGLENINAEGHAIVYNGSSEFANWWIYSVAEVSEQLQMEGRVTRQVLEEFFLKYHDSSYWTTTIAFTAVTAQRPKK
jgi:SAM-dependent methyltransferase